MGSSATASVLTNQFIRFSATTTESARNSNLGASFYKICRSTNKGLSSLSFAGGNYKVGNNVATKASQEVSYLQTEQEEGTWEEPDIGSDSESDDEDEEVEDENLGFESDWEEEETKTSAITDVNINSRDSYEEQVKKGTFF